MGTRLDVPVAFPRPLPAPPATLGEALEDLRDADGAIHNHDVEAASRIPPVDRRRLARIPEGRGIRYERDELAHLPPRLRLGLDWEGMPEGRLRQTRYFRLDRSLPAPTIATHRQMYYHPVEPRLLTVREAARIQSFPNGFVFQGSVASQWRQVGNAVPPLLAKALGASVRGMRRRAAERRRRPRPAPSAAASRIEDLRGRAFAYRGAGP